VRQWLCQLASLLANAVWHDFGPLPIPLPRCGRGADDGPVPGQRYGRDAPLASVAAVLPEGAWLRHGADRQVAPGLSAAFFPGEKRLSLPLLPLVRRRQLLQPRGPHAQARYG